ncbi:hypothetical protein CRT38_03582 [Anaplasma phagocytophilum str. CRT38]|uniref:Secreted protein n=1 Tax=Anaplasma phagocytophilum str. CRT38 TaxID=1269275 RepID=S6G820_ANAPH|nr:hypothetical protein CRT38_03582 [Anaplasma phagocytophilum str. CRT38]KDB57310.1 hypothetical protein P030_05165 [Anaplasma phagocytophilum str. CRT35]
MIYLFLRILRNAALVRSSTQAAVCFVFHGLADYQVLVMSLKAYFLQDPFMRLKRNSRCSEVHPIIYPGDNKRGIHEEMGSFVR